MMPEVARFDSYDSAANASLLNRSTLFPNMSTSSEDSLRKISNDSGISLASTKSLPHSVNSVSQFEELIGEPRLSTTELSTAAMLQSMLAQQQSINAAAALNPAMFGLMSAGLGGLWGNPLAAAAMLQQEATTRKLLESASASGNINSKTSIGPGCKPYPNFGGHIGGLPQSSSPFTDHQSSPGGLRESQLVNRKLSEDLMGRAGGLAVKPTRKSHSFNGNYYSPLNRQHSPLTSTTTSPNNSNRLSPNRSTLSANGDDQQTSPYGDSDSMCSGKSSARSPQSVGHSADNHSTYVSTESTSLLPSFANHQHLHSAAVAAAAAASSSHQGSRRRKNGIVGSLPVPDLSAYAVGNHPAFPNQTTGDIPLHKLSTASMPACLPSATGRNSIVLPEHPAVLGGGSPSTSRKRSRNIQPDEKIGFPQEDDSYWERRRKNNEAAKRSRDSRRAKEDETAIRAAFLEQENLRLRVELNKLKEEFSKLQTELDIYKKPDEDKHSQRDEEASKSANDTESLAAAPEPSIPLSTLAGNDPS